MAMGAGSTGYGGTRDLDILLAVVGFVVAVASVLFVHLVGVVVVVLLPYPMWSHIV